MKLNLLFIIIFTIISSKSFAVKKPQEDRFKTMKNINKNFRRVYSNFNNLELDGEILSGYGLYDGELRDHSEALLDDVGKDFTLKALINFDKELSRKDKDDKSIYTAEEKENFSKLIQDTIMFTYINPEKWGKFKKKHHYYVNSVQPLVQRQLRNILKEFKQQVAKGEKMTIQDNPLLNHINPTEYNSYDVMKRMLLLSLSNIVDPETRGEIIKKPLFKSIFGSDAIDMWLYASSGSDVQYYLNTCAAASLNQSLMVTSNIVSLIEFYATLEKKIEEKVAKMDPEELKMPAYNALFSCYAPSKDDYITAVLENSDNRVRRLYAKAVELSKKDKKDINEKELYDLTAEWSQAMQQIAQVITPDDPKYNSKKPLKEHWEASAALMAIPALASALVPNHPTPLERLDGAIDTQAMEMALWKLKEVPHAATEFLFKKIVDEKKIEGTEILWDMSFHNGGIDLELPGHSVYLRATTISGERFFLLSDPKNSAYKLMNYTNMKKYAKKQYKRIAN